MFAYYSEQTGELRTDRVPRERDEERLFKQGERERNFQTRTHTHTGDRESERHTLSTRKPRKEEGSGTAKSNQVKILVCFWLIRLPVHVCLGTHVCRDLASVELLASSRRCPNLARSGETDRQGCIPV